MYKNDTLQDDFQTEYKNRLTKPDEQQICDFQDVNGFQQLNKGDIYDDIKQKLDESESIKNNDIYNYLLPSSINDVFEEKFEINETESDKVFSNLSKPSIDTFKPFNTMDVFKNIQQDKEE